MTQTTDKSTRTTLATILNSHEVEAFHDAKRLWATLTVDATNKLESMSCIGFALNLLYSKGQALKLKKQDLTTMVKEHFPGLNRVERSEYRKLDRNFEHVRAFVQEYKIKSGNPTYLVNKWVKAVKEDCLACTLVEHDIKHAKQEKGGLTDIDDDSGIKDIIDSKKPASKTPKTVLKKGFDNIVKPEKLTTSELVQQLGQICNKIKTAHNQDKLCADEYATSIKHLSSTIAHLNDVDENIALAV